MGYQNIVIKYSIQKINKQNERVKIYKIKVNRKNINQKENFILKLGFYHSSLVKLMPKIFKSIKPNPFFQMILTSSPIL